MAAADAAAGTYKIIAIAPGTYSGTSNIELNWGSTGKKYLIIGQQGAANTIVDGVTDIWGWNLSSDTVVASLTLRRMASAIYVNAPSSEVRLNDLVVRDNAKGSPAAGLHVAAASKVYVSGCTFLNNVGTTTTSEHIWIGPGTAAVFTNTVVTGTSTNSMLTKSSSATLTTNGCLVKGQTLTGTGNLAGSLDPKIRTDARVEWDSPLRGAGQPANGARSLLDMDGEARPSTSPDIGADQFGDSDGDGLADVWEIARTGGLTTLSGHAEDYDADGLDNAAEYALDTLPTVADTDGDGLSDGNEVLVYGTDPHLTDTDADDMPDGWEVSHGLAPTQDDRFADADGDRYPNVFEYVYSTDPTDISSKPTPTYLVNAAGGTYTTIQPAILAANAGTSAYPIVGIAAGTYSGSGNVNFSFPTGTTKRFLVIGVDGAAKTVIDSGGQSGAWTITGSVVVSSLAFTNSIAALTGGGTAAELRFVDLFFANNVSDGTKAPAIHVSNAAKVYIAGSTFLNNVGNGAAAEDVWSAASLTLENMVSWGQSSGARVVMGSGATLTGSHSLVKGQTLSGTGNLAGTQDPELRKDGRLRVSSVLRGAGVSGVESRIDMDGELRPLTTPDIGVDQFIDADSDLLPDGWEVATFGSTSAVDGSLDADSDALSNAGEYDWQTDQSDPDTDDDGMDDGFEVANGFNPLVPDTDDLTSDLNHDGLLDGLDVQVGYSFTSLDTDGDSISNDDERLMCTDPFRADTDGDGVADSVDAFPLDPLITTLQSDPLDVTPPVITLTAPWYAVEQ